MRMLYGLLLLTLVQFCFSDRADRGTVQVIPSRNRAANSAASPAQIARRPRSISRYVLGQKIDAYVRQKFWYYLPDCHLTYLAHLETVVGCQFLITYQNFIGSYLAVVTYSDHFGEIHVDTFVRLGDGFLYDTDLFKPIDVHPVVIQLDLGDGEYFVTEEDYKHEAFKWNEKYLRSRKLKYKGEETELRQYCSEVQNYIKKQYWYYLTDDTATINLHISRSKRTTYCSFTFLNYVGLWQVVGAWNNGPNVRTFVRLGEGSNPQKSQKILIVPSFV